MASRQPPQKQGYRCDFVQEPPKLPEFRCPICSLVPRDPHLTTCCGRNACLACIPTSGGEGARCPLPGCGGRLSAVKNRSLNNEIEALETYCRFKERGCDWKGKVEVYDKHIGACGYAKVQCQYCREIVQRRHYSSHLEQACVSYPLPCKACGKKVERRYQQDHARQECPLAELTCPFSQVGCKVTLKRKDLSAHFDSAFHHHLGLVRGRGDALRAESMKMKRELSDSEKQKFKLRDEEVVKLQESFRETQMNANVLQKLIGEAEQEVKQLRLEQTRSRERFEADMRARDAELLRLKQSVWQMQELMKAKCYGPPLPRYAVIYSRPSPPEKNAYIPPVTMRITDFKKRKWNNEIWTSPPFYTHQYGYKMCLVVYTNGTNQFRGVWVAVYVSLVKGEYDDRLQWPYRGKITLKVYNTLRNANHATHTITFDPNTDNGAGRRVTDGYLAATSFGREQFMLHRSVDPVSPFVNTRFLKNGCLEIEISRTSKL